MTTPIDFAPAETCAERLRDAFFAYNDAFRDVTRRARGVFERRDWTRGRANAVERIELYDRFVNDSVRELSDLLGEQARERTLWIDCKRAFEALVADYRDVEFTKTYFSSVTRRLFGTIGVDPQIEFLAHEATPLRNVREPAERRTYVGSPGLESACAALLADFAWDAPWEGESGCAKTIADEIEQRFAQHEDGDTPLCIDVLPDVFYRDTRAYVVGQVTGWTRRTPLVIAFRHGPAGVRVDAVIQTTKGVSVLFGYARSYFHADLECVGSAIAFIKGLLPRKPVAELFTVLGRAKQGKTERFRDLTLHLGCSRDRFVFAPGERGLVMIVFTLPSYDIVFKVIRDEFPFPKNTTRAQVESCYDLVFKHDKVGRLIDTQEFRMLRLHRDRFEPDLLAELVANASKTVRLEGDHVVIGHAYLERRLRPLNLYVREVAPDAARDAVLEYGQAIRDLAATDVFPGDLLLKNFGVSRHGRVIFYDYDEVCRLTACNFRDLPEPRTHEEEMASEPWFYVGQHDVFPEEFGPFLGLEDALLDVLRAEHGELLTAAWWRSMQERVRTDDAPEVLPY